MAVNSFKEKYSYPILLTLFSLWVCIGIFPLICYETDGLEIILGCDIMYQEGWTLPPVHSYEYRMQPLITILIVCLKYLMPFFTCEQIYCAISAISAFAFLLGCISFAKMITSASRTKILIAAMLLPEMYAIAMYGNTAIPAAACYIWSLVFLKEMRYSPSVVLMCIAILFRIDIVIVLPAILPLLVLSGKTFKQSFIISIIYGGAVVVMDFILFGLLNASALGTFNEFQKWNDIIMLAERVLAIFGYYSLIYIVLLPLGIYAISAQCSWKELALVLLPIVLVHCIFAQFGNASKHFLYNSPFVIIAGVRGLTFLEAKLNTRIIARYAVLIFVVGFMLVSFRKQNLTMPWFMENPLQKAGTVLPVYSVQNQEKKYSVGIGAGYQVITQDEFMLASGHLFYSWYIHSIKEVLERWRIQQKAVLDRVLASNILTFEWGADAPIASGYLTNGYHFHLKSNMPNGYSFTITNDRRELNFWRIVLPHNNIGDAKSIESCIKALPREFSENQQFIIPASNHYGTYYLLEELTEKGMLKKMDEKIFMNN